MLVYYGATMPKKANRKEYGYTWHQKSLLRPGVIKQHKTQTWTQNSI